MVCAPSGLDIGHGVTIWNRFRPAASGASGDIRCLPAAAARRPPLIGRLLCGHGRLVWRPSSPFADDQRLSSWPRRPPSPYVHSTGGVID